MSQTTPTEIPDSKPDPCKRYTTEEVHGWSQHVEILSHAEVHEDPRTLKEHDEDVRTLVVSDPGVIDAE